MTKKIVKINEMQLRNLVAETIERIAEDTKAQRKKDPMNQWFKDADKLSRLRDMSNPTYDAERQKNIDKALKESGDTRRGSYMKGRTIGRKMAKGDTSTVGKDNLGNYPEMGELGMKDQYGYEMAAKNSGLFGNPFKADERLQDIKDRYERLKHDDKFFGDWDKHINGQLNEAQLCKMISESIKNLLSEYWDEDGDWDKAINSNEGVFNVYTNDYSNNAPVFVGVVVGGNEVHYKVPEEMKPMLKDLGTKQGRTAFLNAITNGNVPSCNIDVLNLKGRGYKSRAFNANAF